MLEPLSILLLMLTGFAAGAFGGLLGLGGATILVPALSLGFGLPIHMVVAVSLISNVFVSITAAIGYSRRGLIHRRTVTIMTLGSIAGVVIGTAIATVSPEDIIKILFGVFLLVIVMEGILRLPRKDSDLPIDEPEKLNVPGFTILGFVMGLLGAILGIGGGTLATPVQQAVDVLGNADAYIGGRWHSSIFALRGGTPVCLLSANTFKMKALAEIAGLYPPALDAGNLEDARVTIGEQLTRYLEEGDGLRRRLRDWAEDSARDAWHNVDYLKG